MCVCVCVYVLIGRGRGKGARGRGRGPGGRRGARAGGRGRGRAGKGKGHGDEAADGEGFAGGAHAEDVMGAIDDGDVVDEHGEFVDEAKDDEYAGDADDDIVHYDIVGSDMHCDGFAATSPLPTPSST